MPITINNESHDFKANTSVSALLKSLSQTENGIAIAINKQVVPKQEWETKKITDHDNILIIQATQGG